MIITGYIVGLSCLFLISYRTLIAFFSDSKAITIYINRFGEQFIDIFAIIFIWIICIVGLIYLIGLLKKKEITKQPTYKFINSSLIDQNSSLYYNKNGIIPEIKNYKTTDLSEDTSDNIIQKINEQIKNLNKD